MMELTTKTRIADTRMGNHSDGIDTIAHLLIASPTLSYRRPRSKRLQVGFRLR